MSIYSVPSACRIRPKRREKEVKRTNQKKTTTTRVYLRFTTNDLPMRTYVKLQSHFVFLVIFFPLEFATCDGACILISCLISQDVPFFVLLSLLLPFLACFFSLTWIKHDSTTFLLLSFGYGKKILGYARCSNVVLSTLKSQENPLVNGGSVGGGSNDAT